MNLFINDTPFFLIRSLEEAAPLDNKTIIENDRVDSLHDLSGRIVLKDVPTDNVIRFLNELLGNHFEDVSYLILPLEYNVAKSAVKHHFKIIDAAGGVVAKKHKVLMIYRLKKWDLPKGKVDHGENFRQTALREVEEETRVKIEVGKHICTTWHTYAINKKRILKRTKWFKMKCMDDTHKSPQKIENIEKVEWMNHDQVMKALNKSYRSIRFVIQQYMKKARNS